jgi:hypothetical protein
LDNSIVRERPGIIRFIWDMFMVVVTILNLSLILFDMTYLRFRPTYYTYFPKAMEFYDPILGIEPHRMTHDYLKMINELSQIETFKDKKKLEERMLVLATEYEEELKEISLSKDGESIRLILDDLEKTKLIEEPSLRANTIFFLYRDGLKKVEKLISFGDYTQLSKSLKEMEKLFQLQTEEGRKKVIDSILERMDFQMVMIIEDNPYVAPGQMHLYKTMQSIIKDEYNRNINPEIDLTYRKLLESANYTRKGVPSTAIAFAWFWRDDNRTMVDKINFFQEKLHSYFDLNYYRVMDMNGKPMSRFWELDAPFYVLFLLEFIISWLIAIRRKTFIAWFFYPIYHWYDFVALFPFAEVRIVRLLRLYSMFLLLQSREYAKFGDDIITRTLRYYSNIIKEEVSDMVTIQILSDAQSEIRSGSSMDVVTDALNANRDQIKAVVIAKLGESGPIDRMGKLVSEALSSALENPNSSFQILPADMKQKLAKDLVLSIFQVMAKASGGLAESEPGKATVGKIIDFVLDEITASAQDEKLNKLNQDITIELIENIKKQVAVKKWLDTSI